MKVNVKAKPLAVGLGIAMVIGGGLCVCVAVIGGWWSWLLIGAGLVTWGIIQTLICM